MDLSKRLLILITGVCCVLLPQGGHALQFINSLDNSAWIPVSSPYACILDHPIVDFGHARFQHIAGVPVEFYLESNRSIFREGKASLTSQAPTWRHQDSSIMLDDVVVYCATDKSVTQIFVDGHADSVGMMRDNVSVSKKRAQVVSDYLIKKGVNPAMIVTRYHGEKYPVAANDTPGNRAKNRRTTVRLVRE